MNNGNEKEVCELVDDFVAYKRSLGYTYGYSAMRLAKGLADHLEQNRRKDDPVVTKDIALSYISQRGLENSTTRQIRASFLRQFSMYLRRMGHGDVYVLPKELMPKKDESFIPYVFSHEEIDLLSKCFDELEPTTRAPTRHLVFPAMFHTMYGCGLRLKETTGVEQGDVDLDGGVILIRCAKGGDERLVAIHDSLKARLTDYAQAMEDCGAFAETSLFFPNAAGNRHSGQGVLLAFQTTYAKAGVFTSKGCPPRVHDLRTTFAVHALEQGERNGIPSSSLLPVLATYMGHRDVKSTEYYLHLSGSLGDAAMEKYERWLEAYEPEEGRDGQ